MRTRVARDSNCAHVRNHQARDGGTNKLRAVSGGRVEMRSVTHGKLAHIGVVGMRLVGDNHQNKAQRSPNECSLIQLRKKGGREEGGIVVASRSTKSLQHGARDGI